MNRQAPRTWDGKRKRGTKHRGRGGEKKKRAEEARGRLAAMRTANTALAASLFLSNIPTQEAGGPMDTSTDDAIGATNTASSSSSPPNPRSTQVQLAIADEPAAGTASHHHDAESDAFLASLNVNTTTGESTAAVETPNEGNSEEAAAETNAGGENARANKPKRKRAFDFFDDSSNEVRNHGHGESTKHA